MISALDAWCLRRLLVGQPVNGELAAVSAPYRRLANHLASLTPGGRQGAWDGYLCGRDDAPDFIERLAAVDPSAGPPEGSPDRERIYATLEDIARIVSSQPWLWWGWIAAGVLNVVASEPGTGKTRFGLDLARRLWFGMDWPDGQANTLPAGSRTLWVQGDRNFAEMLACARDFGLPEEAVTLGASPDDPTGGLDLDDAETLSALAGRIEADRPSLVFIDTVGMVTGRNLCRPEEARQFFAPIMELAASTGVAILGQTHLSKGGEALGRRIVEKARVVLKMTQPDPEGQEHRRRLWVDKSAIVKPPPLGITMTGSGNEYDASPPSEPAPETRRPGPAPERLTECSRWLSDRLARGPAAVKDVRSEAEAAGFSVKTLYAAKDALGVAESQVGRLKWWKLDNPGDVRDVRDDPDDDSHILHIRTDPAF